MQVDGCINLLLRRVKSTERRNRKVFHIKRLITAVFQEKKNTMVYRRSKDCWQGQFWKNSNFDDEGKNAGFPNITIEEAEIKHQ